MQKEIEKQKDNEDNKQLERSDESKKEIEILQEKISRMSVEQIDKNESLKVAIREKEIINSKLDEMNELLEKEKKESIKKMKEVESTKEALDTKNKQLSVSLAEIERLKSKAAENSQLLQEKASHLTECEEENEKLKEIKKILEQQLALFQSEKEELVEKIEETQMQTVSYQEENEARSKEEIEMLQMKITTMTLQRIEMDKEVQEKEKILMFKIKNLEKALRHYQLKMPLVEKFDFEDENSLEENNGVHVHEMEDQIECIPKISVDAEETSLIMQTISTEGNISTTTTSKEVPSSSAEEGLTHQDPIIYRARICTRKARDTYKNIMKIQEQGTVDKATRINSALQDLKSLKKDGEFLIKVSEQKRDKIATQEQQHEKELESLIKKKEKYEKKKREVEAQKNSLEAQLHTLTVNWDDCQRAFNDAQSKKNEAECSLRNARERLEEARDKERAQGTGAVVGGPTGAMALDGAGAGVGTAVTSSDVNQAENHVSDCQQQVLRAETSLNSVINSLQSVQNQISRHKSLINQKQESIAQCDQKFMDCREKISSIKKLLQFLMDSIHCWGIFVTESKDAEELSSHLEEIIQITEENKEYDLITSDGTKTLANSFLEAWEKILKHDRLIVASTDESETYPQLLPAAN